MPATTSPPPPPCCSSLVRFGAVDRLTAVEEVDLACRAKAGDLAARERLILCNVPLALKIARQWKRRAGQPAPTEQAMHGLIVAVDSFDPDRGFRLTTYIAASLPRFLLRTLRDEDALIRVPSAVLDAMARARKNKPSDPQRPIRPRLLNPAEVALRAQAAGGDGFREFLDAKPDPNRERDREDEEAEACRDRDVARVRTALVWLDPRQREVILVHLLGEAGEPRETLRDISRRWGISAQRVGHIKAKAIDRLREILAPRPAQMAGEREAR
jgi:RNA polymerase nonessential primary-like sigma factor